MAEPTAVNGQITDAVTQTNVKVLGEAPAMAMGSLYQIVASANGLSAENAVINQQNANTLFTAVLSASVEHFTK